MKYHLLQVAFRATILVMAAISSSQAASNLNSSKSNVYKPISTAADEAACINAGGAVERQNDKKVCAMSAATNLNSSRSN